MSDLGNTFLGATIDDSFTTVQSTGAASTLTSSPVISAYPSNSTTELTAGITLTADFDSRTGYNHVRVVASTANGYLPNTRYRLVITTGTVNSISAVPYKVSSFGLSINGNGLVAGGTATAGSSTTLTMLAADGHADSELVGATANITGGTGAGQSRYISANVGSTKVITVSPAWTTTVDNTSTYEIFGTSPGPVLTESYAADGAAGTQGQLLYAILGLLSEINTSGTTVTIKKLDGSTTAMVFSVDSAASPTTMTRTA